MCVENHGQILLHTQLLSCFLRQAYGKNTQGIVEGRICKVILWVYFVNESTCICTRSIHKGYSSIFTALAYGMYSMPSRHAPWNSNLWARSIACFIEFGHVWARMCDCTTSPHLKLCNVPAIFGQYSKDFFHDTSTTTYVSYICKLLIIQKYSTFF